MPVRRIPRSYTSLTGIFIPLPNGVRIGFESSLERDFLILSCFDRDYHGIEEQPVAIPYVSRKGRRGTYTPDFLATCRSRARADLVEVKLDRFLKKNRLKLAPKFAAAREFAAERGWRFLVLSERHIRIPRLENARKLMPYRRHTENKEMRSRINEILSANGSMAISSLIDLGWENGNPERAEGLHALWRMIAMFQIDVDLDHPITNKSVITLAEPS